MKNKWGGGGGLEMLDMESGRHENQSSVAAVRSLHSVLKVYVHVCYGVIGIFSYQNIACIGHNKGL